MCVCFFLNVLSQFVSIEPLVLHTRHNVSIVSLYVFTVVGLLLPVCFIWLWVHVTSVCSYFTPPWIRVVSVVVKCFTTQDVLTHLLFMLYIQHLYCHTQSDDTAVFYGSAYFQRKLPYSGWRSWESASLTLLSCCHRVALFLYHTHSIFLDLQSICNLFHGLTLNLMGTQDKNKTVNHFLTITHSLTLRWKHQRQFAVQSCPRPLWHEDTGGA